MKNISYYRIIFNTELKTALIEINYFDKYSLFSTIPALEMSVVSFLTCTKLLVLLTNVDKTMRNTHEGQHALIFCTVEVLLANCLAKALKD